jgi:hypothetical protein
MKKTLYVREKEGKKEREGKSEKRERRGYKRMLR